MASQDETEKIEKISENPSETTNDKNEKVDDEKDSSKKRPVSEVFRKSLKRNAPVFFREKPKSEGTFKENFRKSATDMWKDVRTVFGRKTSNEDSKMEAPNDDATKGVASEVAAEDKNAPKDNETK
ncbi:uncharacterized protein LOC134827328 [Culicoides brevitarsis]|uniref:uncharacterized protein LOC134827328 n=1 Tax=Culicoides brevitarsis TaxID=469753 RepID=UPI00307C2ACC